MTLYMPAGVSYPVWPVETGDRRILPCVVDRDPLLAEGDDGHHCRGGGARGGCAGVAAATAFGEGVGRRAADQDRQTDAGEGGRAELEPGPYAATVAGHRSTNFLQHATEPRPDLEMFTAWDLSKPLPQGGAMPKRAAKSTARSCIHRS